MADTLGSMSASIIGWLRGSKLSTEMVYDAINDAVESLFQTLVRASLSVFMGGPVNLTLSGGTEGAIIVSIADPTVAPVVSEAAASDSNLASHVVDVAYTYVTESGTETMLSPVTTHTVSQGHLAAVHPPPIMTGAFGWNLYAREILAVGQLVKQNEAPLPFLTTDTVYQNEPDSGWLNDPALPQPPTENTTGDNIFYIRHLEVLTSSGALKTWAQADIDSDLMRRFGVMNASSSSSQYQNYAFDILNQRQIEIRPALGADLLTRYFWIVKPRRMRFPNSALPFPTVPAAEFIRQQSLSDLFLGLREIAVSNAWGAKAEKARARCELAVTMINRPKNQKVTPYRT